MGDYLLKASAVDTNTNSNGSIYAPTGGGDLIQNVHVGGDGLRIAASGGVGGVGGTALIRYDVEYYLDGSPTISLLPGGFTIISAQVNIGLVNGFGISPPHSCFLQFGPILEETDVAGTFVVDPGIPTLLIANAPYIFGSGGISMPSALALKSNGMGAKIIFVGTPPIGFIDLLEISGEYGIASSSWTIDTPSPVAGGDEIVVTAPADSPVSLTTVTEVCFTFGSLTICTTEFIEQTPTTLRFVLPSGIEYTGDILIEATTFSGSVFLGTLTYLFEDASGIYTLVRNKTNDTLYDPARDGTTVDVKIPNPRGRFGFIGG